MDNFSIPGYENYELISSTKEFVLCRCTRSLDKATVVIKSTLINTPRARYHIQNEFNILSRHQLNSTPRPIALEHLINKDVLILEDFEGVPVDRSFALPMKIDQFLELGIRIVESIEEIHKAGLIHNDIKPQNILLSTEKQQVKIIDFGIASPFSHEFQLPQDAALVEGSLPYMSPEQTGRMNRAIDNRTDLYSLGVTFYQVITGTLPFSATDPLEWFHCHMARVPRPPMELNPDIPEVLSNIIMRLLEKPAENRYQSTQGLRYDLQMCLKDLKAKGHIERFTIGAHDVSAQFQLPQKLYGREKELATLRQYFDHVITSGNSKIILVSGHSGVGKSKLINELQKDIVQAQGSFLSAKLDQYKPNIPYSLFLQSLRQKLLTIMSEGQGSIDYWKRVLLEALKNNAQLIINVIPQLELIIGSQPPIPELTPTEETARFNTVFQRFIGAFAQKEHPLVLFFDDLQWADFASLQLLKAIMINPDTKYLLIIGAYRENDINSSHPLTIAINGLKENRISIEVIQLFPLSIDIINQLVADTVRSSNEETRSFAELVHKKTGGNPFFTLQFLNTLYDNHLIHFDFNTQTWKWNVTELQSSEFTENVVDLMLSKLRTLSDSGRQLLITASCLGNSIDVDILAIVSERTEEELQNDVIEIVQLGLMNRVGRIYKFSHDRIQQTVYSLIPQESRSEIHLRLGRKFLSGISEDQKEYYLFDIVNHLNFGINLISTEAEKLTLICLNLTAGTKAKASVAYGAAINYFSTGIALLESDYWETQHELAFELYFKLTESEYLSGNYNETERLLHVLSSNAKKKIEHAAIGRVEIDVNIFRGRYDRAAEVGIENLKLFGINLSLHPTQNEVLEKFENLWGNLAQRKIEDLIDLPWITDPEKKAVMDLFAALYSPALVIDQNLICLLLSQMVNWNITHGHTESSAFGYAFFAMVLGPIFGKYQEAYRFGKLAFDLTEKYHLLTYAARVYLCFGQLVNPWTHHLKTNYEILLKALHVGIESGDLTYAGYAWNNLITLLLARGDSLEKVYEESEKGLEFARKVKFVLVERIITSQQRLIQNLRGLTYSFTSFDDDHFKEHEFESELNTEAGLMAISVCWYYIRKLQARFIFGEYKDAITAAMRANELLWTSPSFMEVQEYHYYAALSLAADFDFVDSMTKEQYLKSLFYHQKQFKEWMDNCEANFKNKYYLISAEIARILGDVVIAEEYYETAIRTAKESEFIHNQGISYELASKFYRRRGFELIADTYLKAAKVCYSQWGALGKVRQLEQQNPQIRERNVPTSATTISLSLEQIDLLPVIKASQAISRETSLDQLIHTLLVVVLEQAAAESGYLMLIQDNKPVIQSSAKVKGKEIQVKVYPSIELTSDLLPVSIVEYAHFTGENIILDETTGWKEFHSDEYIIRNKPKSALCFPIVRHPNPIGILYLENKLVSGVFSEKRLDVLGLLATQAAISLENSLYYSRLEEYKNRLESILDNTTAVIYIKDRQGRYLLINQRFEFLFHISRSHIIGKTDYDIFDKDRADVFRANDLKVLEANAPLELEEIAPQEDGLHTYISLKFPLYDAKGNAYGVCGLSTDITERKRKEEERLSLLAQLQEALNVRDEFISIASHELKTPLTSLRLQMQLLKLVIQNPFRALESCEPQSFVKMSDIADQQMNRLSKLVDNLLDISRIRFGKLTLNPERVDLSQLICDLVDRFRLEMAAAKCESILHVEPAIIGYLDRFRIEEVLNNLVSNAIKFGAGKPIQVSACKADANVRILVQDHGIGIKKEDQERIFGRFERAVSIMSFGGLGLGLYISQQIVAAHKGMMRVQSEIGQGSCFIVELPLDSN